MHKYEISTTSDIYSDKMFPVCSKKIMSCGEQGKCVRYCELLKALVVCENFSVRAIV